MGSQHGTLAAEEHGIRRSPHWPTTEKHFLVDNPRCIACNATQHAARVKQIHGGFGQTRGLQVHHAFIPFHFAILLGRPDLELDPRNLCTFCEDEAGVVTEDHHLLLGHAQSFQSYMPDAATLARSTFFGMSKGLLLSNEAYRNLVLTRPKSWASWTQAEKDAMRKLLDERMPKS